MRFITITTFAVIGSLVALAIAKPVPNRNAGGMAIPLSRHTSSQNTNGSIDLDAISSHGISVREKILGGLDNYELNTGTMHPLAVKRSDSGLRTRGASVPLTGSQNGFWTAEISIGTPPVTLNVHIDTGAADMWVLETGGGVISDEHNFWDPSSSASAKAQRMSFLLAYADGSSAEGNMYTDNVTIAGFTADPQTFGSATSYTSELKNNEYRAGGLLGLAFPSISTFHQDSLFASLVRQNRLIDRKFSLKLSSTGAEMYVGGVNSMLYNGDITYARVTEPGFWQVTMDDVRVNGDTILKNIPAIFDSGAKWILGDWNRVSQLYKPHGGTLRRYKGFGYYSFPCDSFPTLSLTFGGRTFVIPPEVLNLGQLEKGSPNCFSAVIGQRSRTTHWNIGMVFLQGVYTVFDYGALQVGFADLA